MWTCCNYDVVCCGHVVDRAGENEEEEEEEEESGELDLEGIDDAEIEKVMLDLITVSLCFGFVLYLCFCVSVCSVSICNS